MDELKSFGVGEFWSFGVGEFWSFGVEELKSLGVLGLMTIDREQNGLYFQFGETDWRGNWRALLDWVKSFRFGEQWEFDNLNNRWWICEELVEDFCEMKRRFIDEVTNPGQFNMF